MKSRIIKPKPIAALYNIKKEDEVLGVLGGMGVEAVIFGNEPLAERVGCLVNKHGYKATGAIYDGQGFDCQFMVLSDFEEAELQKLLALLKPIDSEILKAVVTPHNIDWTVENLITEILREHEKMKNLGK